MPPRGNGLAASILSFAFAVLAACFLLRVAADLLLASLPVLLPAAGLTLVGYGIWRYRQRPRGW